MSIWKRAVRRLAAVALCALTLTGCAGEEDGLSLSVWAGDNPETLDPIYAVETGDQTILANLYENLMRLTPSTTGGSQAVEGIARSVEWADNYDGTWTVTFQLRKADWTDGRPVTAEDFVFAWQRLADPANDSPWASLLSVVSGYEDARESGDMSLLQVAAPEEDTLEVVLTGRYDWFLTEVCTAVATMPLRRDLVAPEETAPEETPAAETETVPAEGSAAETETVPAEAPWWSGLDGLVTNGPYQVADAGGVDLVLGASESYHGQVAGPQTLTFRFADREEGWTLYENGEVDFAAALSDEALETRAGEDAPLPQGLNVASVLFNCEEESLMEPAVRQAMAMVIDRNAAAELAGPGTLAAEGLVPAGVRESEDGDFRAAGGALLDNDPETYGDRCGEARRLLAGAGYDGETVGQLEYLYVDTEGQEAIARTLAGAWQKELGIRVTPRGVTAEEMETALETGEFALAGVDFAPVGGDAECYLTPWISTGGENWGRYINSAYDTLLAIIAGAEEGAARLGCLHDAEALLLGDCALVPLYTSPAPWALREAYTGLCRDSRGWFLFQNVAAKAA